MAEEEKIREHAKYALQALTDKKRGWKEKLKDFLWEILIIIIAVNITLWFHSWSEKRNDRELEKNFLVGIRNDLDIVFHNLRIDSMTYQPKLVYYDSICTQIDEHRIDKKYVDANRTNNLLGEQNFSYDNSRFENFKSSGFLRLIKSDSLSMNIASLYTIYFPMIKTMDEYARVNGQDLVDYIGTKAVDSSGNMIVSELLNAPEAKFKIKNRKDLLQERQTVKRYVKQNVEQVISQIDRELKTRFKYEVKSKEEIKNASR